MRSVAFKTYKKKIDIYVKDNKGIFVYTFSTIASPTCRQAKRYFCETHGIDHDRVLTRFSK